MRDCKLQTHPGAKVEHGESGDEFGELAQGEAGEEREAQRGRSR